MPKQAARTASSATTAAKGPSANSTSPGSESRPPPSSSSPRLSCLPPPAGPAATAASRTVTSIWAVYRQTAATTDRTSGTTSSPATSTAQGCEKRVTPRRAFTHMAVAAFTLKGPRVLGRAV